MSNRMKDSRLELHEKLCEILGSRNVYYQPPESIKIVYPAIVYERSGIPIKHGDDIPYLKRYEYNVTVIDKNPDSEIVEKLSEFKYSRFVRHYAADGLNHDSFKITY